MNKAEKIIKNITKKLGIYVRYDSPASNEEFRRILLLKAHNIDTVFDIGANIGQYAVGLINSGFNYPIISIEPLPEEFIKLEKKSTIYSHWNVAPRCAIGEKSGDIKINVSKNSVSSSILKVLPSHLAGAPESEMTKTVDVKLLSFEDLRALHPSGNRLYLKIDVQGYEKQVINGINKSWDSIMGLELEISVKPLYEGQDWLLGDVLGYMQSSNFNLMSLTPGFTNPQTGEVLQYNGIFMRL